MNLLGICERRLAGWCLESSRREMYLSCRPTGSLSNRCVKLLGTRQEFTLHPGLAVLSYGVNIRTQDLPEGTCSYPVSVSELIAYLLQICSKTPWLARLLFPYYHHGCPILPNHKYERPNMFVVVSLIAVDVFSLRLLSLFLMF